MQFVYTYDKNGLNTFTTYTLHNPFSFEMNLSFHKLI